MKVNVWISALLKCLWRKEYAKTVLPLVSTALTLIHALLVWMTLFFWWEVPSVLWGILVPKDFTWFLELGYATENVQRISITEMIGPAMIQGVMCLQTNTTEPTCFVILNALQVSSQTKISNVRSVPPQNLSDHAVMVYSMKLAQPSKDRNSLSIWLSPKIPCTHQESHNRISCWLLQLPVKSICTKNNNNADECSRQQPHPKILQSGSYPMNLFPVSRWNCNLMRLYWLTRILCKDLLRCSTLMALICTRNYLLSA